jgi:hypothetical protein
MRALQQSPLKLLKQRFRTFNRNDDTRVRIPCAISDCRLDAFLPRPGKVPGSGHIGIVGNAPTWERNCKWRCFLTLTTDFNNGLQKFMPRRPTLLDVRSPPSSLAASVTLSTLCNLEGPRPRDCRVELSMAPVDMIYPHFHRTACFSVLFIVHMRSHLLLLLGSTKLRYILQSSVNFSSHSACAGAEAVFRHDQS